jgi:hypothetical protein
MLWLEKQTVYIDQHPFSPPAEKHVAKQHVSVKTTTLLLLHVSPDQKCCSV